MIRSLDIAHYRGFKNYKVDNVADINLFVGKNNVGKSSLIEAIQLLSSITPITVLAGIARRRTEGARLIEPEKRFVIDLTDISHAFYGHKVSQTEIKLAGEGVPELRITCSPLQEKRTQKTDSAFSLFVPTTWQMTAIRGGKGIATAEVTDSGYMEDTRRRRSAFQEDRAILISPDGLSNDLLPFLYNAVVRSAAEVKVVESLKLLDDTITGIYLVANTTSGDITPGGILLGRNGAERNPLGSYGDGMRRMLTLSMAFVNVPGGVVLVDEIDTGLHFSIMHDLWNLVIGTAHDVQAQVFATTHSLDCVNGLRCALRENPSVARRVAVHKIDSRLAKAVSFTGDDLIKALESDLELR